MIKEKTKADFTKKNVLVGAHMSIAKGVYNSIKRGFDIGATTIQIFTANQRQWVGKKITTDDIEKFKKAKKEYNINLILSHSNYLINLGSCKKNILHISREAFKQEILRCHMLDIDYLVFHPGSATTDTEENCLDTIVESLLSFKSILKRGKTELLLENTAGQGTNVGYKFEHLSYIIKNVKDIFDIGVCFDTCHGFNAGYDLREKKAYDETFDKFSKIIGIKHLKAFHLNDSKTELGSRKDRHASIGHGKINENCFKMIMKDDRFLNKPKILETPDINLWKKEIEFLKNSCR